MAKVLELHTFELKPGTQEKVFEEFVIRVLFPVYRNVPGQNVHLLKGDRGERAGKYSLLVEVESVERRDQIYPPEDQDGSPEEIGDQVSNVDQIWDMFFTLVDSDTSYTSYVMLSD
jgi:hypothetical protein